ncbi:YbjN domain-containing protein [Calidifontibacter sp. DB0510]|uniref:YbjN domain-containing protein n=1 Tax=Metallococcus carri TaxID=1656884 RepID=A0A967E8R4_9MICO|nr:YbjN domain-containing protein [Metallococcus carri]NHN55517.1 YbjN domain-containing protein [Metallococcus carri]NOP38299.1 YbjN domain-containing protein [Calidifontibacter sp. DB2511S]
MRQQVLQTIRTFLQDNEIEHDDGVNDGEIVVTLPGDKKLKTVASLTVGERDLVTTAFVIRNPDERHEQFYRFLLQRNLKLPGLAYRIDTSGDVYVTGRVPLKAVDAAYLDQLLGTLLTACDEPFNDLLAIGFLTSMRKEWAWRIDRGESTRNLEAFRHLLES